MSDKPDDPAAAVNAQEVIGQEEVQPLSQVEQEEAQAAQVYSHSDKNPTMHVKVYSPFKNYFNGQAFSISGQNATGPFDILPHHHNFISLLNPCVLFVRSTDSSEKRIMISGGIMHVKADQVIVFLDV